MTKFGFHYVEGSSARQATTTFTLPEHAFRTAPSLCELVDMKKPEYKMNNIALLPFAFAILASVLAFSQKQLKTLAVSGCAGTVPLIQINGKTYAQLDVLAQVVNGSLSFHGNQAELVLSRSGGDAATPPTSTTAATNAGFSKDFLRAGIEEMSTIREWRSALAAAIQNQYPLTQDWLSQYQASALTNLRHAQAAATTDSDQNAAVLIANEYQKMMQLNDKYVAKRATMNYITPDALTNDPLDHSIVACGKSLGAMAANGQFTDDGTCH